MKKKTRNLLYGFLILLVLWVSWWDGITPLTPITKVDSLKVPADNEELALEWPERIWVKGKIIKDGSGVGFLLDDGSNTITVSTKTIYPVELYVLIWGKVGSGLPINGYTIPSMGIDEIHVVLFFQTDVQITFFVGLLIISSLIGLAVWSIPKIQETRIKKDNKLTD